ncbi:Calcium/proton exchanger [Cordyceps fumosorosea ARSEF 2679]|uniref:Vacuolar calcium ion transporter n=1 Tax=Cordyceps fumosorosea (strain ARSEF 2679) TaxID=1081104 RepID=A0A168BL71_CORFA|nr:Calcium/proton exchanger [Cordyceps fumosorosea ARSEF 2679]OAA70258.1 Calcium/proton exchanger [Cordyceps fumosorosea ARSEF 2679]
MDPTKSRQDSSERTPLLNGEGGSNAGAAPTSRGAHHHQASGSKLAQFFTNSHYTPGTDHHSLIVRSAAYSWHTLKATLLSSYVNLLLVLVPIGIAAGMLKWSAAAVFTLNFFAIIPLAAVLAFATEALAADLGEALGGLLNATFGNAVELIVSIVALRDGQIEVVQSSMLGSILSNLLLVMGMCFLFGGLRHRGSSGHGSEQVFSAAVAQTTCSLMALSSASLVLPAALYAVMDQNHSGAKRESILVFSRGTAIILLILYVLYLVFQLRTHRNLFDPEMDGAAAIAEDETTQTPEVEAAEDDEPEVHLGPASAFGVLVVVTVLVSICADYLVGSIDEIVASTSMSKAFIGLILLPIVGNAAEHASAVYSAVQNKMDLAMSVAIGSSIQIALGVTPFLVIVGWIMNRDMTLRFETFQTVSFAVSVLVVTYTVQDGKSNYLEGAMLIGLYTIIAVAFYATPADAMDSAMTFFSNGN